MPSLSGRKTTVRHPSCLNRFRCCDQDCLSRMSLSIPMIRSMSRSCQNVSSSSDRDSRHRIHPTSTRHAMNWNHSFRCQTTTKTICPNPSCFPNAACCCCCSPSRSFHSTCWSLTSWMMTGLCRACCGRSTWSLPPFLGELFTSTKAARSNASAACQSGNNCSRRTASATSECHIFNIGKALILPFA